MISPCPSQEKAITPPADEAILIAKGTTFLRTCFNAINALSGVGVLSIPFALSQGGWLSLPLLFLVPGLCFFTGLLLQRCMNKSMQIKTYPDIGELAFGAKGRAVVSVCLYLTLYLLAVEFLILEGDNLDKLFPDSFNYTIGGRLKIHGKQAFVLLTALVILPTTWLRSLGVIAYVSLGGVVACFILAVCVMWIGTVDGIGFREDNGGRHLLRLQTLPTAVSLFTFSFAGHYTFPTLCNSMADRTQLSKVLLITFATTLLTYGWIAMASYLMYGENLKSPLTLNFPVAKISSQVAIYTTLVNPVTKYAIVITPIATAFEERYLVLQSSKPLNILMRTSILVSTVIIAIAVPFFGYIMAFIGSALSVIGTILLPCLCYMRIHYYKENSRSFVGLELLVIVGIMVVGVLVGVVGTCTSVKQIVQLL